MSFVFFFEQMLHSNHSLVQRKRGSRTDWFSSTFVSFSVKKTQHSIQSPLEVPLCGNSVDSWNIQISENDENKPRKESSIEDVWEIIQKWSRIICNRACKLFHLKNGTHQQERIHSDNFPSFPFTLLRGLQLYLILPAHNIPFDFGNRSGTTLLLHFILFCVFG